MPGRNGTGPDGTGPTGFRGRSAGRCVGPDSIDRNFANGRGFAYRARMGRNGGYGRRWQNMPQYNTPTAQPSPTDIGSNDIEQELSEIKNAIIGLNQKLEEKQKIIDELQQKLESK
jgi:hypothetical protein